MNRDTEYAWAAGFIEADGCIHLTRTGNGRVQVVIVQKDRRPLDRLQRIFGLAYAIHVVRRSARTYWRLTVTSQHALELLTSILPYLDFKRAEAVTAIALLQEIANHPSPKGRGRKISPALLARRTALVEDARFQRERLSELAPAALAG